MQFWCELTLELRIASQKNLQHQQSIKGIAYQLKFVWDFLKGQYHEKNHSSTFNLIQ